MFRLNYSVFRMDNTADKFSIAALYCTKLDNGFTKWTVLMKDCKDCFAQRRRKFINVGGAEEVWPKAPPT